MRISDWSSDVCSSDLLDEIRAGNDSVIVLAAKYPEVVPIATVHPYDGQAALDELERVAAAGVGVLKIHAHTQRFDVSDPRVETLVRKIGRASWREGGVQYV